MPWSEKSVGGINVQITVIALAIAAIVLVVDRDEIIFLAVVVMLGPGGHRIAFALLGDRIDLVIDRRRDDLHADRIGGGLGGWRVGRGLFGKRRLGGAGIFHELALSVERLELALVGALAALALAVLLVIRAATHPVDLRLADKLAAHRKHAHHARHR